MFTPSPVLETPPSSMDDAALEALIETAHPRCEKCPERATRVLVLACGDDAPLCEVHAETTARWLADSKKRSLVPHCKRHDALIYAWEWATV